MGVLKCAFHSAPPKSTGSTVVKVPAGSGGRVRTAPSPYNRRSPAASASVGRPVPAPAANSDSASFASPTPASAPSTSFGTENAIPTPPIYAARRPARVFGMAPPRYTGMRIPRARCGVGWSTCIGWPETLMPPVSRARAMDAATAGLAVMSIPNFSGSASAGSI